METLVVLLLSSFMKSRSNDALTCFCVAVEQIRHGKGLKVVLLRTIHPILHCNTPAWGKNIFHACLESYF